MALSSITYSEIQLITTDYAYWAYFDKSSHLSLLWNCWTKFGWDCPWVVSFQIYVRQRHLQIKMVAITI